MPEKERLQQIRSILIDEDISFLETFSKEYSTYFQEQIKADLGYFNHGSGLLDKAIASIRGRVEIDRAKSDRNLQITILAVGTSIGVGGIVASSYTLVTKEEPRQLLRSRGSVSCNYLPNLLGMPSQPPGIVPLIFSPHQAQQ